MVRELFVLARDHAPSIIFMDEIDSIGGQRLEGEHGDSEVQRTMMELLNQLDGFESTQNIKVGIYAVDDYSGCVEAIKALDATQRTMMVLMGVVRIKPPGKFAHFIAHSLGRWRRAASKIILLLVKTSA